MDVKRIVENHLYNKCCEADSRTVDLLLKPLVTELQSKHADISEAEIINALEDNLSIALQYREYSGGRKEISLVTYQWDTTKK